MLLIPALWYIPERWLRTSRLNFRWKRMRLSIYAGGNFKVLSEESTADGSGFLPCLISLSLGVKYY